MRLSIVIPVFNEAATVAEVIRRALRVELALERELIVVDDGSTDGTTAVLREAEAEAVRDGANSLICHYSTRNRGKGSAVRRGLEAATGDIILLQDADLELDPAEYPRLLAPILAGETSVVFGRRSYWSVPDTQASSRVANAVLGLLTTLLYGQLIVDMETAYKVMRRETVLSLELVSNGFEIEPELTAKLRRMGQRILEVPIRYEPRSVAQGKKMRWKDGFLAVWALLRWRFAPLSEIAASQTRPP